MGYFRSKKEKQLKIIENLNDLTVAFDIYYTIMAGSEARKIFSPNIGSIPEGLDNSSDIMKEMVNQTGDSITSEGILLPMLKGVWEGMHNIEFDL